MLTKKQPIGIFDSGIGGLIALRKLAELMPYQDFIYIGDTARVPYGNRSAKTITQYSEECTRFLLGHSVKQILIACNTVSAVALSSIQHMSNTPIVDVIQPAVDVVIREKYQRVGVIGTRTTIQSHSYEIAIQQRIAPHPIWIYTQECPLFVPIIEEGWENHAATFPMVETYLSSIQKADVQALILGCTHYSFLAKTIQKLLPDVRLIDSGEEAASVVAQLQTPQSLDQNLQKPRKIVCYLTDLTDAYSDRAKQFLGFSVDLYKAEL